MARWIGGAALIAQIAGIVAMALMVARAPGM
jgi:hypothetical protein